MSDKKAEQSADVSEPLAQWKEQAIVRQRIVLGGAVVLLVLCLALFFKGQPHKAGTPVEDVPVNPMSIVAGSWVADVGEQGVGELKLREDGTYFMLYKQTPRLKLWEYSSGTFTYKPQSGETVFTPAEYESLSNRVQGIKYIEMVQKPYTVFLTIQEDGQVMEFVAPIKDVPFKRVHPLLVYNNFRKPEKMTFSRMDQQ